MRETETGESGSCGCDDDPETVAGKTATATGFAGSVLGAAGGPAGAALSGLVWGTAGYVAGYTAASAKEHREQHEGSGSSVKIDVSDESDEGADGDPDAAAD